MRTASRAGWALAVLLALLLPATLAGCGGHNVAPVVIDDAGTGQDGSVQDAETPSWSRAIHVVGHRGSGVDSRATYWRSADDDTTEVDLDDALGTSSAESVAIYGDAVVAAGWRSNGTHEVATLWRVGDHGRGPPDRLDLSDGTTSARAHSVVATPTEVIVGGFLVSHDVSLAVLWRTSLDAARRVEVVFLTEYLENFTNEDATVWDLGAANGIVHACGTEGLMGEVWSFDLASQALLFVRRFQSAATVFRAVSADGAPQLLAGSYGPEGAEAAAYWRLSGRLEECPGNCPPLEVFALNASHLPASAASIRADGTAVTVAGWVTALGVRTAVYWQDLAGDGVDVGVVQLSDATADAEATALTASDEELLIAGWLTTEAQVARGGFWRDRRNVGGSPQWVPLGTGDVPSVALA